MTDLDECERVARHVASMPPSPNPYSGMVLADPQTLIALVAELRIARRVIEACRALQDEIGGDWAEVTAAREALASYDQLMETTA
jgi:hypothetical protein